MSKFSPIGGNEGYGGYEDDMAYRDCPHTPGIICDGRGGCERCGWYPPEEKRRLEMIRDGKMKKSLFGNTKLWIKKKSRPSGGQEVPV